jgi:hypothetical protein
MRPRRLVLCAAASAAIVSTCLAQWVTRGDRWYPRGPWMWAMTRELPHFRRESNGIDFGHAHLAETLLRTQNPQAVEKARLEVLDFIFSWPAVKPDEEQVAPTFVRMAWEAQRAFDWAHALHQSLYDLFASSDVKDKERGYREIVGNYLEKPEAITSHRLDHHGKLWGFPESKSFKSKFPMFNVQIWSYHWLQAATYDVQLKGDATRQRELLPRLIEHYHGYLRQPPVEWNFMPMFEQAAPEFTRRFPEAASILNNLHMLHDNIDDVLCSPERYPDARSKRKRILEILDIYLHRQHEPADRFAEYHMSGMGMGEMKHEGMGAMTSGQQPPSADDVLDGRVKPHEERPGGDHSSHQP